MFVFACARCDAALTVPLAQVSLPAHARQTYGNGAQLPVLMKSGTFAVDPDPWGGPWRRRDELHPGEAEARGIHAPAYALSDSEPGAIVISPGELTENGESTPPFEPISTWGGRSGTGHYWSWSPQWEAAAGHALAHLLAASEGQPVEVPKGLTADVFQRALDALLPVGPPKRRAVLAGPGQPTPDAGVDIILVPVHPQTGQTWTPARSVPSAYPVPLPLGVWLWLVSAQPYLPVPATGGLPHDVLRDDPLPPRPNHLFRADRGTFQHTLVRLPAVRSPWLRTILENLPEYESVDLF